MTPHEIILRTVEAYRAQLRTHWNVAAARDAWQATRPGQRAALGRYLNALGVPSSSVGPAPVDRFEQYVRDCVYGLPIRS